MSTFVTVGPANAPKRQTVSNGIIIRYGYQPLGATGYAKYAERIFPALPPIDMLCSIINQYNSTNGINEIFNSASYGY